MVARVYADGEHTRPVDLELEPEREDEVAAVAVSVDGVPIAQPRERKALELDDAEVFMLAHIERVGRVALVSPVGELVVRGPEVYPEYKSADVRHNDLAAWAWNLMLLHLRERGFLIWREEFELHENGLQALEIWRAQQG